jgi:hypothetical protein
MIRLYSSSMQVKNSSTSVVDDVECIPCVQGDGNPCITASEVHIRLSCPTPPKPNRHITISPPLQ